MKKSMNYFSALLGVMASFANMFRQSSPRSQSEWRLEKRPKGIRNPKDPIKKAAIERRRKAKRLSMLSKPKRRAIYYYNLKHRPEKWAF